MFGRMQLVLGALAGMATALVVAIAVVVTWPTATPNVLPKPTAVVLPSEAPSAGASASPTPFSTAQPSVTIAPFGDQ
ncbi:MAG TPA: hypothetical protein VFC12_02520 [Terriglobales bacterium]|jgi:hypothetical protein|nr:hypothetical protein [Terriglobales bacterium]